ncbi:MAG: leucine-rich repeat domain-containing protein [Eubacterium sp.]|nr:leucine-rich repeat domain-containing protein [Eubacterium sp.]
MSKKQKDNKAQNDFLAQEAKEQQETAEKYTIDIPEDEIWTYQIEGLQPPHISQPFKNAKAKKIIVVIALLIAIGLAMYFSVRAVHSDPYEYKELEDGTYELVKFSNPGDIIDVTIDYVVDLETGKKDTSKPISVVDAFAFNCDEKLNSISFGKDVKSIDGKSIYSCWWITNVFIDDENPYYCDLDGVIYNKDLTEVIFYPNDHDKYLRGKLGYDNLVDDNGQPMEELWGTTEKYDDAFFAEYNKQIRTYVVPSTVTKIGELAFAYSNITDLYIPEGVKKMESMAVFKNTELRNLYSYTTDKKISDVTYKAVDSMKTVYNSLPEGLEYIGSDCFYYCRNLSYMYIPSSVTYIGHHAFWDAIYKEDKELKGITAINTDADEETFNKVKTGDEWRPKYDYMLFKKSVDINYSAERQ